MRRNRKTVLVPAGDLRLFVTALFEHAGLPRAHAMTVADSLVLADLCGVDTHGVCRTGTYLARLRKGVVAARPDIRVVRVAPSVASVDGGNGMGAVVGTRAVDECVELARENGIGLVSVKRSTHFGMAAYYVRRAIREDMIGMAFSNASPALPPWGGRVPFFGTNPLAVGVPGGNQPGYVLDMAMSVIARGSVYAASEQGRAIPAGAALDAGGHPTTDPKALIEGGTMLPFGAAKGAALAMMVDILSGVLTGAGFGDGVGNARTDFERPQNVGHLFIAIRPDLFMRREAFLARVDMLIERVKAQPKASGFTEILVPGERRARTREQRLASGIPLSPEVVSSLRAAGEIAGVPCIPGLAAPRRQSGKQVNE